MNKRRFFTLVELLIVIVIIIVLAGILLPVTSGALKKADQTKALAMAKNLENAIKMFKNDYGYIPFVDGNGHVKTEDYYVNNQKRNDYKDLIKTLQGKNSTENPKSTRYLDVYENTPGVFNDPWDEKFLIYVDNGSSGSIALEIPGVRNAKETSDAEVFYFSVVVISKGPDRKFFEIPPTSGNYDDKLKSNADNVYSFPTSFNKKKHIHTISK